MLTQKVVPTEAERRGFNLDDPTVVELVSQAEASHEADAKLTVWDAVKKYKTAVFWAMFLSTSLIMEGFDLSIIGAFYGQTQFKDRFGTTDPVTGEKSITAPWTSGLSNSSAVGQLFGLAINAWAQDRFGCRPTMMFFMTWLVQQLGLVVVEHVHCGKSAMSASFRLDSPVFRRIAKRNW
ncbi:hypothetical protein BJX62DRAFT_245349 [Aspergillus germanicus]